VTALRPSAPGAAPCGVRIDRTHEGPVLTVQVVPRARRAGVVGVHGDALKLAVHAPPVEGAANAAVLAALSEWAGVSRSSLRLVSGASARRKRILFTALTVADLWDRLRVVAESEV
jgi:uncharacterized protein (TIGR00251 family)